MRKLMAMAIAAAMTFSLAACGTDSVPAAPETKAKTETAADTKTEAAPAETAAAASESKVKAGFIFLHDENSTYDKNFMDAAAKACQEMGIESIVKTNIGESDACYEAAAELVDEGCNFIFADSFGHEPFMIEAAKEFPEVQFCHATGTRAHTEGLDNFHNAFATIYEGRYLAGITAGLKLNEMIKDGKITAEQAKMGYVGAYTYAEVISGYTSFYLGAKSVCPTVTMDVNFTGSWYDETAEKECANTLIQKGAVLISQHADSMGAPTACETAGVPNVSYNGSTNASCPETFLVSSRINWTPYFKYAMECTAKGEEIAADWTGTVDTGSVELSEFGKNIAEGTEDAVKQAMADLKSGKIHVFDTETFTVDGKKLDSYLADVDTDEAYTKDTEVITDGYFDESGENFRSAPYFDLQIDGINLLDTKF